MFHEDCNYKKIFELAPVNIFILNSKGEIEDLSLYAAEMLGMHKKLLIKKLFFNFLSTPSQLIFKNNIEILLDSKLSQSCDLEQLKKQNASCLIHVTITFFENDYLVVTAVNSTRDNQLELTNMGSAFGEMVSVLTHEINQPLSAINIYSHACLDQFKKLKIKYPSLFNVLEQIKILSKHVGQILHRMKNFIREGELCRDKVNINNLIKESLIFFSHQSVGSKFEVQLNLDENIPDIFVDKIKIMQVILNLSQNSMEAFEDTHQSKLKIYIDTEIKDGFLEVNFRGNGPGIYPELFDKIMKSYFTTKKHGAGLGLRICRTIIKKHGGKLFLKKAKKGAWIIFTLPIVPVIENNLCIYESPKN